jgi:hypothetical protein
MLGSKLADTDILDAEHWVNHTRTIQMEPESGLNRRGETVEERQQFFGEDSSWKLAGWIAFTVLLCLHFCLTYIVNPFFLNMEQYVQGQAATPFQYRVLPMYVYRALLHTHAVGAVAEHMPKQVNSPYTVVLLGIAFCSLLGAVFATSATIARLTDDRGFGRWMSLLVVYMSYFNLAPHWGLNYTLPYDVPSLFFFCMGVYLVISRRWWAYYLLFPIAVLNRETICFLTVFFVVWEWFRSGTGDSEVARSMGKRIMRLLPHALIQAAIWFGIKLYLAHRFVSNPAESGQGGAVFAGHLSYNLHELISVQQWPVFLSICGFLLPALWVGRKWIRCAGMSWGCGIVMGLWFLGMMKVGVTTEIRIFSEWTAFIVPALALIVYHRFRTAPPQS